MSLRILLADDSMTAQNMGKKILSDAGYEVVAVSNGAAALKKAAELKPDLVVLDIYMPGYTGLEVCERLKNAPDTSTIPVMLTVGKLEPYRPEEGARVRAEGVIIKPFEATDLLAAVQKIISKAAAAPEPAPVVKEPEQIAPFAVMPVAEPAPVAQPVASILPDFGVTQPLAASAAAFEMPALDVGPLPVSLPAIAPVPQALEIAEAAAPALNAAEPLPAINLDFLKPAAEEPALPEPVPAFDSAGPAVETEHVLEPAQPHEDALPEIGADPALAIDPADVAEFAVKVGAVSPVLEEMQRDPLNKPALPEVVEPEMPAVVAAEPTAAGEPGALAFALADTQPIPHVPERLPDGAGAAAIELFHEEYDPAEDGSIDLSVPTYRQAAPPVRSMFSERGLADFAQTPALDEFLTRQEVQTVDLMVAPELGATEAVSSQASDVEPAPLGELSALLDELPTPPPAPEIEQVAAVSDENPLELGELEIAPAVAAETEPAVIEPEVTAVEQEQAVEPEAAAPLPVEETVAAEAVPLLEAPASEVVEEPAAAVIEAAPSVPEPPAVADPEPTPEPASHVLSDFVPASVAVIASAAVAAVAAKIAAPEIAEAAVEPTPITEPTPVVEQAPVVEAQPIAEVAPVVEAAPAAEAVSLPAEGLSAVDRARIAGAVQRVFDRYKPQIIAEITRELMKQNE